MWVMYLNDMRSSQVEIIQPVARSESKEALLKFLEDERVSCYREDGWWKNFRKESLLEWFNPPYNVERAIVKIGTIEELGSIYWRNNVEPLPLV